LDDLFIPYDYFAGIEIMLTVHNDIYVVILSENVKLMHMSYIHPPPHNVSNLNGGQKVQLWICVFII